MTVQDGDVIRVTLNATMPDLVVAQNVYYWQLDDPVPDSPTNDQIRAAIDAKLTAMIGDIQSIVVNDVEFTNAEIDRVEWETDHWETKENLPTAVISTVGTETTDMIPSGCAAVLTADTSRPQTRGRKFLPGFYEAGATDNDWIASVQTALTAFAVEWALNRLVTGSAELVPAVLGMSGASAGLIYPIAAIIVNSLVGYQRRRKPGVGS